MVIGRRYKLKLEDSLRNLNNSRIPYFKRADVEELKCWQWMTREIRLDKESGVRCEGEGQEEAKDSGRMNSGEEREIQGDERSETEHALVDEMRP